MLPELLMAKLIKMVDSVCSQSVGNIGHLTGQQKNGSCGYLESHLGLLIWRFDIEFQRGLRFCRNSVSHWHIAFLFKFDSGMFWRVGGVPG